MVDNNKENARFNVIIDFLNSKSSKTSEFKVYNVSEFDSTNNKYFFRIIREKKIFPSLNDTINGVAKTYFPTNFIEKDNKLFLWGYADKNNIITSELVEKLQKYNIVDSMYYMVADGRLPKDSQEWIATNGNVKSTYYIICKKNITQYLKIINNKVISTENYPDFYCD